jgi:hypothetical protein
MSKYVVRGLTALFLVAMQIDPFAFACALVQRKVRI